MYTKIHPVAKEIFRYGSYAPTGIETENTVVMVSNGIGTVFLPLRFFARPQVMVIYLRKE